jgi:hypothetical protein
MGAQTVGNINVQIRKLQHELEALEAPDRLETCPLGSRGTFIPPQS